MLKFTKYVPYHINQGLLANLTLEPNTTGEAAPSNNNTMSAIEMLRVIVGNKGVYTFNSDLFYLDVTTGGDRYSFDSLKSGDAVQILKAILNIGRAAGNVDEALYYTWYYFENDSLIEDIHEYYHFFVCKGDCIIDPMITISDGPPFSFPETFLLENKERYLANDSEDRNALTCICYEKWQQETLPGRIYAMKAKIELSEEGRMEGYLTPQNSFPLLLREISLIRNHLSYIKALLFCIVGVLVYIVIFKLR